MGHTAFVCIAFDNFPNSKKIEKMLSESKPENDDLYGRLWTIVSAGFNSGNNSRIYFLEDTYIGTLWESGLVKEYIPFIFL